MDGNYRSEVIIDSEPEREELRQRDKRERRHALGDVSATKGKEKRRLPRVVIDILDEDSIETQRPAASPSINMEPQGSHLFQPSNLASDDVLSDTAMSDKTQSDDDDDGPRKSLARFAFVGAAPPTRITLSRQASSSSSIAGTKLPAKKSAHRFAIHFSDHEIARVLKCVCCDIKWTARKTAAQKMIHIQSCAKKKHLSDETVRILLRKEIDSHLEDASSHKGKARDKTPDPQTFLEKVVAEAAPRKRSKKKGQSSKVQETVQVVSHTRGLILDKARAVIGTPFISGLSGYKDPIPCTQAVGARDTCSYEASCPPQTQVFGTSALAQARQGASRLFSYTSEQASDEEDSFEIPSSTQAFAPSRLGALSKAHCVPPPSLIDPSNTRQPSKRILPYDHEESPLPPRPHASIPLRCSQPSSEDDDDIMFIDTCKSPNNLKRDDDAFLHYYQSPSCVPCTSNNKIKLTPSKISKPKARRTSPSPSRASYTKATPSRGIKSPIKGKKLDGESIESLEVRMKELIMRDNSLYLRVLRYEPIHFDVFLQIMLGDSHTSASDKQKMHLRSVLDRQAIHFYGIADSGWKRRRRKQ